MRIGSKDNAGNNDYSDLKNAKKLAHTRSVALSQTKSNSDGKSVRSYSGTFGKFRSMKF